MMNETSAFSFFARVGKIAWDQEMRDRCPMTPRDGRTELGTRLMGTTPSVAGAEVKTLISAPDLASSRIMYEE